jgi:hypothetical protein
VDKAVGSRKQVFQGKSRSQIQRSHSPYCSSFDAWGPIVWENIFVFPSISFACKRKRSNVMVLEYFKGSSDAEIFWRCFELMWSRRLVWATLGSEVGGEERHGGYGSSSRRRKRSGLWICRIKKNNVKGKGDLRLSYSSGRNLHNLKYFLPGNLAVHNDHPMSMRWEHFYRMTALSVKIRFSSFFDS